MESTESEPATEELTGEQAGEEAAESRLQALAAAIREHEASQRRERRSLRQPDVHLYRRLRQICGGSA